MIFELYPTRMQGGGPDQVGGQLVVIGEINSYPVVEKPQVGSGFKFAAQFRFLAPGCDQVAYFIRIHTVGQWIPQGSIPIGMACIYKYCVDLIRAASFPTLV